MITLDLDPKLLKQKRENSLKTYFITISYFFRNLWSPKKIHRWSRIRVLRDRNQFIDCWATDPQRAGTESLYYGGAVQNSCQPNRQNRRSTWLDRHPEVIIDHNHDHLYRCRWHNYTFAFVVCSQLFYFVNHADEQNTLRFFHFPCHAYLAAHNLQATSEKERESKWIMKT